MERAEWLTFVETTAFTKCLAALGLEESLRDLQFRLLENPEAGDVEPGTSGLRKIRLGDPTRGKGTRGGARAHYLWLRHKRVIYLLYVYSKNEASTLSAEQKRQLRDIVARIKQES